MIRAKSRWIIEALDEQQEKQASELKSALSLSPLTAKLLVLRGMDNAAKAAEFLHGGSERLHDPFQLKGMGAAVGRIKEAAELGQFIRIYGDYDADGVSSTSLMIGLFKELGCRFDYYIPHRTLEGYGLNTAAIDKAVEAGVGLIVTVDTGISAVEQVRYAKERGIDIVVTDHHEPPAVLPDAYAIVNPKQPGCNYPFKGLAGAGVAFKLGHALLGRPPLELADLAAIGTIADLMPLTDENRIIVRCGLDQLRHTSNPGLRALAEVCGIELASVTASSVAFGMAPRINASGRLDHADRAVRLMCTSDPEEAGSCAEALDVLNKERQRIVEGIVEEAESMWIRRCEEARNLGKADPSVIVLAGEGWNAGVVGIVASKLIERHYKPTLILGIDAGTGMCKGSARSIEGYDMYAALSACSDLLDHYGGHQAAAGMSLRRENLPELESRLSKQAEIQLSEEDWIPKLRIDMACRVGEADLTTIEQIALLEPFGSGNPQPRLLLQGIELQEIKQMGKDGKHLRLSMTEGRRSLEAVGFGLGELSGRISDCAVVDLVGELSVNEWNGSRRPQLMIRALQIPHVQLFDRRGVQEPQKQLSRLITAGKTREVPAVVLVSSAALRESAAASSLEAGTSGMMYVDYEQWPAQGISCGDLYLLDQPPSVERFAAILKSAVNLEAVHALYSGVGRASLGFPEREHFGNVFQILRRHPASELTADKLQGVLSESGWPAHVTDMMIAVFEELNFIERDGEAIRVVPSPAKRDLSDSERYRRARGEAESNRLWHAPARELAAWIRNQSSESASTNH